MTNQEEIRRLRAEWEAAVEAQRLTRRGLEERAELEKRLADFGVRL